MADRMNGNVMLLLKIVGVCLVLGGLIVGITQSHTILSEDVSHLEDDMESHCAENLREHGDYETSIKDIDDTADEINISVATILTDIEYLKKGQGEILQEVKELKNR